MGWGLGAGGWGAGGWVLLGWTGLVLLCTAQNPARLVYGSAALVASLRGQHCHFATLPMTTTTPSTGRTSSGVPGSPTFEFLLNKQVIRKRQRTTEFPVVG